MYGERPWLYFGRCAGRRDLLVVFVHVGDEGVRRNATYSVFMMLTIGRPLSSSLS